ncbi:MAG: T9SS type A sorting domain-containing protein [Fibrobacter sp.]|nr:T9SS type A sorting domain-containing protein [Fibrobacter sp.]
MSILKGTKRSAMLLVAVMAISSYSQNSVTYNVNDANLIIPPGIYGVLMERLGRQFTGQNSSGLFVGTNSPIKNTNGMRQDVIDGFIECGVTAAEWPGGCAANGYNWSANKRPGNDVGVDRFIEFCKLTGAEAIIVGKPNGTDAASNLAFCQYVVDSLKYPLRWFKIGNEVWGCGGNKNVNAYKGDYTTNYDRLKNYFSEKNIKIAGSINYGGSNEWMNSFFDTHNGRIDGFEIHEYLYFPDSYESVNPPDNQYWDIVHRAYDGQIGPNLRRMVNTLNQRDPQNKVKLIFDEWGDWLKDVGDGWEQKATLMDALSASEHLHLFMQHSSRVEVAGLAQAVSVIHSLMNINTQAQLVKTPTFYVFKMFKPHHLNDAKVVPTTQSNFEKINKSGKNLQAVTSFASVDKEGVVSISFSNVDKDADRSVTVSLNSNIAEYVVKSAEVITGPAIGSANEYNQAEQINIKPLDSNKYNLNGKQLSVTLPSKSVAMIRLEPMPVSVEPQSSLLKSAATFSVKTGADRSVFISSSASMNSPVTVSLYGIDGRTLIDRVSTQFDNGNSICLPGNKLKNKGIYIVRIQGENLSFTEQVVISR